VRLLQGQALAAGQTNVEGADGAGDVDGPRGLRPRLAGDLDGALVYLLQPVAQPEVPQLQGVCAERVRLDYVGAGVDVVAVHL